MPMGILYSVTVPHITHQHQKLTWMNEVKMRWKLAAQRWSATNDDYKNMNDSIYWARVQFKTTSRSSFIIIIHMPNKLYVLVDGSHLFINEILLLKDISDEIFIDLIMCMNCVRCSQFAEYSNCITFYISIFSFICSQLWPWWSQFI